MFVEDTGNDIVTVGLCLLECRTRLEDVAKFCPHEWSFVNEKVVVVVLVNSVSIKVDVRLARNGHVTVFLSRKGHMFYRRPSVLRAYRPTIDSSILHDQSSHKKIGPTSFRPDYNDPGILDITCLYLTLPRCLDGAKVFEPPRTVKTPRT